MTTQKEIDFPQTFIKTGSNRPVTIEQGDKDCSISDILLCLEQMKANQQIIIDLLGTLVGPGGECLPCPETPPDIKMCDYSGLLTYAQPEFEIVEVFYGSINISDTFTLPVNGNSAPDLQVFKDELVAALESFNLIVEETQGRDGWLLEYNGEEVQIVSAGEGAIIFDSDNCIEV